MHAASGFRGAPIVFCVLRVHTPSWLPHPRQHTVPSTIFVAAHLLVDQLARVTRWRNGSHKLSQTVERLVLSVELARKVGFEVPRL